MFESITNYLLRSNESTKQTTEPIKHITFSGGGAKGAVYGGVYKILKKFGVIDEVEDIAGTSAGAITAAFVATGISAEEFEDLSNKTNFKDLLGKGLVGLPIVNDAIPLYELLRTTIATNIQDFLTEFLQNDFVIDDIKGQLLPDLIKAKASLEEVLRKKIDDREKYTAAVEEDEFLVIDASELYNIDTEITALLQQRVKFINQQSNIELLEENLQALLQKCTTEGDITFGDLALLRTIAPEKFKNLMVTATNYQNGDLTIFSGENTPNVEIALACKASAAIPGVFQGVQINGVWYYDGGCRDNVPIKYYAGSNNETQAQCQTLAFVFGGDDLNSSANKAIYSATPNISKAGMAKNIIDNALYYGLGIGKGKDQLLYTAEQNKHWEELREIALNVVPLGTGNIGTLSFDEAAAQAKYLTLKGETQTMRYLINHNMIDQSMNDSLALREFFLTVYEKVTTKENPQNYLLNFVEEEKWHNQDPQIVIKEFIELTIDSNVRDEFMATLNCKQASNVIKNVCYDYTLDNIDLNSSMVFADTDNIVDYEFYLNNHFNAFGSTHYEDFGLLGNSYVMCVS